MDEEILNLGSGTKVSADPRVANIDFSIYLRIGRNPVLRRVAPVVLSAERRKRLAELPPNVYLHDLREGIPRPDQSVAAVYHSHVLEHIDRDQADAFIAETYRVLRPGGILRVVVPDLERAARSYLADLDRCAESGDTEEADRHDKLVAAMFEQSVRREAYGTSQQSRLRRFAENRVLGDARRRGETHQWMYDRVNLEALLRHNGFGGFKLMSFDSSAIPGWNELGLDRGPDGGEHLRSSLYAEVRRPG